MKGRLLRAGVSGECGEGDEERQLAKSGRVGSSLSTDATGVVGGFFAAAFTIKTMTVTMIAGMRRTSSQSCILGPSSFVSFVPVRP